MFFFSQQEKAKSIFWGGSVNGWNIYGIARSVLPSCLGEYAA